MLRAIVSEIRPSHWIKNIFVFAPLFFSGNIQALGHLGWAGAITFLSFSLIASSIYVINDLRDAESDRQHPQKRNRPIASGLIKPQLAYLMIALLFIAGMSLPLLIGDSGFPVIAIIFGYWVMNIAYCLKLKQYAIVDVFIISAGFVLRLIAGGVACDIWLSPWIVCLTFLIALFMAFAKRRDDVVIFETTGVRTRKNTVSYNLAYLNQALGIIAAVTIVCYIIYSVSSEVQARLGSPYVYSTSIFVLAGIMRYLQITIVEQRSGSPTKIIYHDRFIQTCLLLWIATFVLLIYF